MLNEFLGTVRSEMSVISAAPASVIILMLASGGIGFWLRSFFSPVAEEARRQRSIGAYVGKPEYSVNEAADLWVGINPDYRPSQMPRRRQHVFAALNRAAIDGLLPGVRTEKVGRDMGYFISRDGLKTWARQRGERPRFLFRYPWIR